MNQPTKTIAIPAEPFGDDLVDLLIAEHVTHVRPALQRLWDYYRNPLDFDDADDHRAYSAAQQAGLPDRITRSASRDAVVENDIGWRVHTLVDFMFGRPVKIESLAADPDRAALIGRVLEAVIEANGGPCFYHDLALLGGVYGFVDLLLRTDQFPSPSGVTVKGSGGGETERGLSAERVPSKPLEAQRILRLAQQIVIETVEAPRAIPVPDPGDYRKLHGYIVHYTHLTHRVDHESFLARLVDRRGHHRGRQATIDVTEVWTDLSVRTYHDGELVGESANRIGRLPVVHVQNLPQPFFYEGLSEVEHLIPLQDELNIRLTDRANRVTMQSFKMYLVVPA